AFAKALPFVGLASVGLIAAALFIPKLLVSRRPSDFHIQGSVLSILDDKGRELWKHDTGLENLAPEDLYRSHFQFRRINPENWAGLLPYLVIKDLDGDGRAEVLFSTQTQDEFNEGELICFGSKGDVRWRVRTGREMRFGEEDFSADYRIYGLVVTDLDGDGQSEIVVDSVHRPNFPCQLLILDHAGKTLGEYWNSGHFNDIVIHDLDGDGKPEIIAGGTNNEYRSGCLTVFRADRIRGASPQSRDEYLGRGLDPGTQEFYVLLPRTDVEAVETPQAAVAAIDVLKNDRISAVMLNSGLYYDFGFDFRTMEVRSSHRFEQFHSRAAAKGEVKSILDDGYFKDLRDRIRFWGRNGWSSRPD
ncbi:MAG TPA: VCBS repeat-containing protein, partial [Acidobacteriota bacterium]|nr:VCBS repeat-containing protein [Acidobacteriota bacterium]